MSSVSDSVSYQDNADTIILLPRGVMKIKWVNI